MKNKIMKWLGILACAVAMAQAQAADDMRDLLLWQGQESVGNKIKLTKSVTVTTAELTVERDLEIDLNGFDLCIKNVGTVLHPFKGHITLKNSMSATKSVKVYFPFCFDAIFDKGVTDPAYARSGSLEVNEGITFGPGGFGLVDSISSASWMEAGKHIRIKAGAICHFGTFVGARFCVGAFLFEKGSRVCKAIRDFMVAGHGAAWAALNTVLTALTGDDRFFALDDGDATIEVTKVFSAWPWRDRLYVGYRVSGIRDIGVDYGVQLYVSYDGTEKFLYGYTSDNGFEHLVTSGHHEVQFDTDGVLGTGWGSFFPKNLNTRNTRLTAVLTQKIEGKWVEIKRSSKEGFLIDNRAKKTVELGKSYPIAYSGVGFFGLPGLLTFVTYETREWKSKDVYDLIFHKKIGSIPYLDIDLKNFKEAHIEVGTKDWTPTKKTEYHWQHLNGIEVYAATLYVVDRVIPIPQPRTDLVYNGHDQTGVFPGDGYTLSGVTRATDAGSYTAYATPKSGVVWSDGTSERKTLAWPIAPKPITAVTFTLPSETFPYTGSAIKPQPSASGADPLPVKDRDYTVGWSNNVNPGDATVIVSGMGNYTNSLAMKFTITEKEISVPKAKSHTYDGTLKIGVEESKTYVRAGVYQATDAGDYTATVTPATGYVWKGGTKEQKDLRWTISARPGPTGDKAVTCSPKSVEYEFHAMTTTVTVKDPVIGETLTEGTDYTVSYKNNDGVGKATAIITYKGNYSGTAEATFTITSYALKSGNTSVTLSPSSFTSDGKTEWKPAVTMTVTVDGQERPLVSSADYEVEYLNNVQPGTAMAIITGKGIYAGSVTNTFEIAGQSLAGATVTLNPTSLTYPDATPPEVTVTFDGQTLVEGKTNDYMVVFSSLSKAGKATATVIGCGAYTGTNVVEFTINQASISDLSATVEPSSVEYNGSEQKPEVKIEGLKLGKDFTVEYENNVNAGENTAWVTVTGIGNYTGTIAPAPTFTITPASLSGATVTVVPSSVPYDGTPKTPTGVTVSLGGKTLVLNQDYEVSYSNNTDPGRAKVTVSGINNYKGTAEGKFTITQGTLTGKEPKVAEGLHVYNGHEQKPTVTIDGLTEGVDFTVDYADNMNSGTATVTITGIGNYKDDTLTVTFTIEKKSVKAPTAMDAQGLVYDGTEQSGLDNLDDASDYTLTGVTTATEIGSYTATATLKDTANTQWEGGSTAPLTITWQIKAATVDEDGVLTVKNQDQFIMGLPRFINEGTVTIRADGFTPALPDGYLWKTLGDGLYAVSRVSGATTSFVLDTRTTRTLGAAEAAQALTHSATAWGAAADAGVATISYTRNGGDAVTNTYADDDADATWTAEADGTYVFTHQPSGLTATFVVEGLGPEGSGTASDPYVVYNAEEFAEAVARGKAAGQSPIYIRLGANLTGPLTVADAIVSLDMNGFSVTAENDGAGHGYHAFVVTGTGRVDFTGTGTVTGGDGDLEGATAVAGSYTKVDTVKLVDGVTGRGTEDAPYIVKTRAEFENAVKIGTSPVWIRLGANIPETVTVNENKDIVCDLYGYAMTGTAGNSADAEARDGRPAIDVWGTGKLELQNTKPNTTGTVTGGRGADGNPPGAGGAGVLGGGGQVTVGANVVVRGGNGGLSTDTGDVVPDAPGGLGVDPEDDVKKPVEGEILPGLSGDGTEKHPYLVADNGDVERAIAAGAGATVYMRLVADFTDTMIVDNGAKGVNIDTYGHNVAGGTGDDGYGKPGVAVLGTGDVGFRNTGARKSVVAGGDGKTGGAAVKLAKTGATYAVESGAQIDFVNGKNGDGSELFPYEVSSAQEIEELIPDSTNNPVYFKLTDDITDTPVAIDEDKDVVIDLFGHDITGGEGDPAIDVKGTGNLTITDSSPDVKGTVKGGDGASGEDGASGVVITAGTVTVDSGATVAGGNGGGHGQGEGGKGAAGVTGQSETTNGGRIVAGSDGASGGGTQSNPYKVANKAQFEETMAKAVAAGQTNIWVELTGDIAGSVAVPENMSVHLDLGGHGMTGTSGTAGSKDGQAAVTIGSGAALELTGSGTVTGGDGADDWGEDGEPGAGAAAIAGGTPTKGQDVVLADGCNGRTGDGSKEHPYILKKPLAEVAELIMEDTENDPVYIKLVEDLDETLVLDSGKNIVLDTNGHQIDGGTDVTGKGLPAIAVTPGGTLAITNGNDEVTSVISGGDGHPGAPAVTGVEPTVSADDNVILRDGLDGHGTEDDPYEVADNDEVAAALEKGTSPVYLKLTEDFDETLVIDAGEKDVVLDTNGYDVDGGADEDGFGQPGISFTGTGSLTVENTDEDEESVISGGDGKTGGKCVTGTTPIVAEDENVTFADGRNGDGSADYPYEVSTAKEIEELIPGCTNNPACFVLTDDITDCPVTIVDDTDVVIDLKGHDITGGTDATSGNGTMAIAVMGDGDLTITDSSDDAKGTVKGGDGKAGGATAAGGNGATGVFMAGGTVTVINGATVKGGNGGNSLAYDAGCGQPGVSGAYETTADGAAEGFVVDGRNGVKGDGSEEYPYEVRTRDELIQVVNETEQNPIAVKLLGDIYPGVTLDGDKDVLIDLNGHGIYGAGGEEAGADGEPAITLSPAEGEGSLELKGPGVVEGGDGADVFGEDVTPGKGGKAIVPAGAKVGEGVDVLDGADGLNTNGQTYYVRTKAELEYAVNTAAGTSNEVNVVLLDDITVVGASVTFEEYPNAVIDLHGHSIEATGSDGDGNGFPAIAVEGTGTGCLAFTNSSETVGYVIGADAGKKGGKGGAAYDVPEGVAVSGSEGVVFQNGLTGTGTSSDPYLVSDREEFERAVAKGTEPVYIKLVATIWDSLVTDKHTVLDLNGFDVWAGQDADGNGETGITVEGGKDLTLTGSGNVYGGKGAGRVAENGGDGGAGIDIGTGKLTVGSSAEVWGGNGGDSDSGQPGFGALGVVPEGANIAGAGGKGNVHDGEDGQSFIEMLKDLFYDQAEVGPTEDGGHRVILTGDVTGPVYIPDSVGKLEIDMNGYSITGRGGMGGENGADAVVVTATGVTTPAEISFVTGKGGESEGNRVTGGKGGDSLTGKGGNGGAGIRFEDGANARIAVGEDVVVSGGQGGRGGDATDADAGDGGAGGTGFAPGPDALIENKGEIRGGDGGAGGTSVDGNGGIGGDGGDSGLGYTLVGDGEPPYGDVKGGNGGDGGDSRTAAAGYGGFGGDYELDSEGESGSSGMAADAKLVILEDAFGAPENAEVTQNEDGTYTVELKGDITDCPVRVPDTVGSFVIDLKGHGIIGANGTEGSSDGTPAIVIGNTGKGLPGTTVTIVNSVPDKGGHVTGGSGCNGVPGGNGASGVVVEGGRPTAVRVVGDGVVVEGGNGGDTYGAYDPGKGAKGVSAIDAEASEGGVIRDGADGKPQILIARVQQHYPWDGKIDIDYTVLGDVADANLTWTVTPEQSDKERAEAPIAPATGSVVDAGLRAEGTHRVTIDTAGALAGFAGKCQVALTVGESRNGMKMQAVCDFRTATEAHPAEIATADDFRKIAYSARGWSSLDEAGTAEVRVTVDGKTTTALTATDESTFTWEPTVAGPTKLEHVVNGVVVDTAWFDVMPSAVGAEQVKLPVEFGGEHGEKKIVLPWKWIEDIFKPTEEDKKKVDELVEKVEEVLENGLTRWQNAILGRTGEPSVNDIGVNEKSKTLTVTDCEPTGLIKPLDDVDAVYVLKRLVGGEWVDVPGKVSKTPIFNIDLEPDDPTGLYRIYIRFTPTETAASVEQGAGN